MKLVIFDFDGTLADTETLITQTMMKTIEAMHLEPRSREEIRAMIGLPLKETFTRLIPMPLEMPAPDSTRRYSHATTSPEWSSSSPT